MRVRYNRNKTKIILNLLAVLCLLASVLLLVLAWEQRLRQAQLPAAASDRRSIQYIDSVYVPRDELDTVLILGIDKFGATEDPEQYRNNQQSDFMLLLSLDRKQKTYTALHLNRDTMTEIPVLGVTGEHAGSFTGQLALSHTYGTGGKDSCRNSVEAVSDLLHGVKIDHYLSLTMDAVAILNDYAGGVTVDVLDDFSEVDPTLVQGETVTLKGDQALTYVRTRKDLDDSSNLHRMERQRQYLTALREQIYRKSQDDPNFFAKALTKVSDYMVSDVTVNQMSAINEKIEDYTFTGFQTLKGEAVKGDEYMEYYVDEDALMETVLGLYFKPKE